MVISAKVCKNYPIQIQNSPLTVRILCHLTVCSEQSAGAVEIESDKEALEIEAHKEALEIPFEHKIHHLQILTVTQIYNICSMLFQKRFLHTTVNRHSIISTARI